MLLFCEKIQQRKKQLSIKKVTFVKKKYTMKNTLLFLVIILFNFVAISQEINSIYDQDADAKIDIKVAIEKAKLENKNVFIMMGGNWCPWCLKFHDFISTDKEISSVVEKDYIFVLVNYDRKKKDWALLEELKFPQRFGFPVFIILNQEGEQIHIQNSAYLEKDKSYDKKRVLDFFLNWNPKAISKETYTQIEQL